MKSQSPEAATAAAAVPTGPCTRTIAHLCTVKVHQAQCEELQADREAEKQPEGEGGEGVGGSTVFKVEGEEECSQGGPQQAQEQECCLVAEAFVAVPQNQPELSVHEGKQQRVEDGVGYSQTQLYRWGDSWCHGGKRGEVGTVTGTMLLQRRLLLHPSPVPQQQGGEREVVKGEDKRQSRSDELQTERRKRQRRERRRGPAPSLKLHMLARYWSILTT